VNFLYGSSVLLVNDEKTTKKLIQFKYRPDIDGLRAFAVILVVAFHAFPEWVPGGFIGVDIFFVISGFLISSILLEGLNTNTFSFLDFYSRRILRLFPALLLVLSCALLLGWFTLFADEFSLLGKHVYASATFFQNFNLLSEVGYFDEAGITKPLLHLWSLGIEEQFYLIWPFLLWLGYKLKIRPITLIVLLGISSFVINIVITFNDPKLAFFSPITRFWELLIGALLAYLQVSNSKLPLRHLSIFGLGFVLIGVLFISDASRFPGFLAVLPVMGAFFIIASNEDSFINRYLLSNKVMVGLGLISYPLYLWHWLILSFIRITQNGEVSWWVRVCAIIIALILALLTYSCVEKPIKQKKFRPQKTILLTILMIVMAFIGWNIHARDGLAFRSVVLKNANLVDLEKLEGVGWAQHEGFIQGFTCKHYSEECMPLNSQKKKILVWGDSHARMMSYGINQSIKSNWESLLIAAPGCNPAIVLASGRRQDECTENNAFATSQIQKFRPEIVLLAQRDAWDPVKVDVLFNGLVKMGVKKVLYLGKSPEWTAKLPKIVMRRGWLRVDRFSKTDLNLENLELDAIAKKQFQPNSQKQYIDLIGLFCRDEGCMVFTGSDIRTGLTSFDTNHLSPIASEFAAKELLVKYLD
jgi:peptidoglycan/LPS O-acetylase OafA/YrhL